ncbi:MAG: 4Fe-4S binding protein [Chloroflexi bacterium]|nr:4Fe-4S binding protein [Chloroflexota bacterium]
MSLTKELGSEKTFDLLQVPWIASFLRSRWYPLAFEIPLLVIFSLILGFSVLGTTRGGRNFATVMTWTIWWPLLPILLILFGRAWCAICPIASTASHIQRAVGEPERMPGHLLRNYGVWFMSLSLLFLTWVERMWGITTSPRFTGAFLLLLLFGAITASLIYRRRAFCRYLCPIGALTGLYSMTAIVELRSKSKGTLCKGCQKECYRGDQRGEGCPMYEFPRTMDSNRNCNLCAQCIKVCPKNTLELRLRPPGGELWSLRTPYMGEAFLALLMVALVYLQSIDMTFAWSDFMKWILERTPITGYNLTLTLIFAVALVLMFGLYRLVVQASSAASMGESWQRNFASFGYAYLPLALAGHLGHNLSHLKSEGMRALRVAAEQLSGGLIPYPAINEPVSPSTSADPLALAIVLVGVAGSFYVAWRIGKKRGNDNGMASIIPHWIFLLLLSVLFIQMFTLPMNPRHAH